MIYDIVETPRASGFTPSYTRVGGVMFDVNADWVEKVREFVAGLHAGARRTWTGCSTATASSSTAPRASAC